MEELSNQMSFSDKWHAEKLLKKSKKKARKQLQSQGFTHTEATKLVKSSIKRIATNKPEKRAAGRGS